jgi:hypothetical protein
MTQSSREALRALFPRLDDQELSAARERLERYVRLAIDVSCNENAAFGAPLTHPPTGVSVIAGQVEPRTFKNTG